MNPRWQLKALMKANLIRMKRSCCATVCEIVFPMILMLLLVAVRRAIAPDDYVYNMSDDSYFASNSSALIPLEANQTKWNNLTVRQPL